MMKRLAGVALAAAMACGWASGAEAYSYRLKGVITFVDDPSSSFPELFTAGSAISIDLVPGEFSVFDRQGEHTDIESAFSTVAIYSNRTSSTIGVTYKDPSFITNDGVTSSIRYSFGTDGQAYSSPLQFAIGIDGGFYFSLSSNRPNIPLDPTKTFGAKVDGSGSFGTNLIIGQSDDGLRLTELYGVSFNINSIEGGDVLPVPLPPSGYMLGLTLLGYAGVCWRSKRGFVSRVSLRAIQAA